jgi:hypothetical protein
MTAAAALVVVTGIASAQTLKFDVPFAFRAGDQMYPAGSYRVVVDSLYHMVHLDNAKTREGRMILPVSSEWAPKEWREKGEPTLGFECGLGRCTLAKIWTAADISALNMPHARGGRDEVATLRVIHAARVNGD